MKKKISGMILREDVEFFKQSEGVLSKGYLRQQKILERAEENLKLFGKGQLDLNPRDYPAFAQYINTFAAEEDKERLFERMRKVHGFDAEVSLNEQNMSNWEYAKTHYAQIIKMPQQKNEIKKSMNRASSFIKKAWQRSKVAIITATVIIGSAFGIKTDSHSQTLNHKQPVVHNATPKKLMATPKTIDMKSAQDSIAAAKYKKIYQNFYSTKLEILTSAAKGKALCDKVEEQINKGIFTLPANMGKEQVAYIDAMYKAYGLKSPVAYAINAKQKLSQEQQNQLIKDLTVTDSEIKKQAKSIHGKLSNHSSFNKAGLDLQKRHITNLKQLRDLKQKSAVK